jgi:RHS repeat-associated protein
VSHFSWDAENRLTQVAVGGGGGTVSYRYDPFGRRIARILGNITELTLYDGWNPVAEYANTPQSTAISLKRTFVWGLDVSGSLQGAGGVGGLLAIREAAGNGSSKAGQAIFPAYDGNGNIIRLFNSNGATVASYAYDGFGNRINPAASDIDGSGYANENRYGFSTKPRDPLTGLLYYGYRWYDPATGRWASRDPIGESGGVNLYGFVGNDSQSWYDNLGQERMRRGGHPAGKGPMRPSSNRTPIGDPTRPIRVLIGGVGSILTGDLFSKEDPIPAYGSNQCEFLITATGIFMEKDGNDTQDMFLNRVSKIDRFKHIKNQVKANNPTNFGPVINGQRKGLGDVVQILINDALLSPTVADLRLVRQIEGAAKAAERNGCCCWQINVVAHSQGTMLFRRSLEFLDPETKKHINFIGLGGQTAINGQDAGLGHAENLVEKNDPVPHKSPTWIGKDHTEFDTKFKGLAAHSWEEVYLPRLETSFPSDFPGKCP